MSRWNRMQSGPRTGVGAGARSLQRRNFYAVIYSDGRVGCFGSSFLSAFEPPPEHAPTKALAASDHHIVALRRDGRVVCWGANDCGECAVPADLGPCKAVAAGTLRTIALTEDGRVVCWGQNYEGQCNVPADLGPCKEAAAGDNHTVALTEDGRVVCWGANDCGECDVPELIQGSIIGIHAGDTSSWALDAMGMLHVWGAPLGGWVQDLPSPELVAKMTDDAWLDFAVREYPSVGEDVFPARIRALPQFEAIRAMHRLAGG